MFPSRVTLITYTSLHRKKSLISSISVRFICINRNKTIFFKDYPPKKKFCTASLRFSTTFPLLLHLPHRADVLPEAFGVVVKVENPSRSGVEFAAGF